MTARYTGREASRRGATLHRQASGPATPHDRAATLSLALAAGLAVLALAAGCSNGSGDGAGPVAERAGTQVGTTGAATSPAAAADTKPSRTATVSAQPGVEGQVHIGFVGLVAYDRLARLTLTFTPRYAESTGSAISINGMFGLHAPEITLVDAVNLKRYIVVRDSKGSELGSDGVFTRTENNRPVSAEYMFAAPPRDVRTLDVYLDDRMIFGGVEVTR